LCLLKGCERSFQPKHPCCRYCSAACAEAAKKWRRWLADQKYRSTEQGKEARKDQSKRYRERRKEDPQMKEPEKPAPAERERREDPPEMKELEKPAPAERVGDTQEPVEKKSCCHRPGCYEQFIPDPRAPHQKYCSPECARAMRRVLVREKRYRDKLKAARLENSPALGSSGRDRKIE
jgi:hypothetical protein